MILAAISAAICLCGQMSKIAILIWKRFQSGSLMEK
jgi:hypothetical protein